MKSELGKRLRPMTVVFVVVALLTTVPLFAGGKQEAAGTEKAVVTVGFAPSSILADDTGRQALVEVWERSVGNKYTIQVGSVIGDNFPNAMLQSFATGQGYDVYENWGPADCKLAGIATDITDFVTKQWPDYSNGLIRKDVIDQYKTGDKFYFIPKEEGWKLALVYRADWLRALGMQPPTSIDEFKKVAIAMTQNDPDENGKNDTYGFVIENDSTWNLGNLIFAFGADNYFTIEASTGYATGKGYLKDDAFKKEITMLHELYQAGAINPNSFITSGVVGEYLGGRSGMVFTDTAWNASRMDAKFGSDNWGVVPFGPVTYNGGGKMGISTVAQQKGAAHMLAAWEVLRAFYSPEVQLTLAFGPEGEGWVKDGSGYRYLEMTKYGGNITGNLRTDINFYDMSGISNDPKQAYHAMNLHISAGHLDWLPNREKIERKMDAMMGKTAIGELTPDQAVAELNTTVDEAFKEIGVK